MLVGQYRHRQLRTQVILSLQFRHANTPQPAGIQPAPAAASRPEPPALTFESSMPLLAAAAPLSAGAERHSCCIHASKLTNGRQAEAVLCLKAGPQHAVAMTDVRPVEVLSVSASRARVTHMP